MVTRMAIAVAALALLAACGQTKGERALSGAGIGAAAGAGIGAMTDTGAGTGALLGGAAGAAVGGLTNPNQIDLGKPIWQK